MYWGRNTLGPCAGRNVLLSNSGLGAVLAGVDGADDVVDVVWLLAFASSNSLARASATAFALMVLSSYSSVWTAFAFGFVRSRVGGVAAGLSVSAVVVFEVSPVPVSFM